MKILDSNELDVTPTDAPLRIDHPNGASETLYPDGGYTYQSAEGHSSYANADGSGGWMAPDGSYGWWDSQGNGGCQWADGSYDNWYADGGSDWSDGSFGVLCQNELYEKHWHNEQTMEDANLITSLYSQNVQVFGSDLSQIDPFAANTTQQASANR